MIYTITLVLSVLILINFLLLRFSCNKTAKRENSRKPMILKKPASTLTTQSSSTQLAATGS